MSHYDLAELPPGIRSRIEPVPSGCWRWTGKIDRGGYGQYSNCGAHRLVYEGLVATIAPGLQLDHLCRVVDCVNPDHLEPVTPAENNRRKEEALGIGRYATHCAHGHEFTPENTYPLPPHLRSGRRDCRTCRREAARRYRMNRRAA